MGDDDIVHAGTEVPFLDPLEQLVCIADAEHVGRIKVPDDLVEFLVTRADVDRLRKNLEGVWDS